GDASCTACATPAAALAAALAAQHAFQAERWGAAGPLRVRMALHSGPAEAREGDYFGPTLSLVARLLDAGHGGQILLARVTAELVQARLPAGSGLRALGEHRLKGLAQPEAVFQFSGPDLPTDFPALRAPLAVAT